MFDYLSDVQKSRFTLTDDSPISVAYTLAYRNIQLSSIPFVAVGKLLSRPAR